MQDSSPDRQAAARRPRARDLGVAPGLFPPGRFNAITDVAGVRVGHATLVERKRVRTGVTAVLRAVTTSGNGHTVEAIPVDRLRALLDISRTPRKEIP